MPAFVCEVRVGLGASTKAELARRLTEFVNEVILSDLDLISVIFHDLPADNTFRAGVATHEAVIFGHIRKGRSTEAVSRLGLGLSRIWSEVTGMSEDQVEIAICEYPAASTFRYGARLPEPPTV